MSNAPASDDLPTTSASNGAHAAPTPMPDGRKTVVDGIVEPFGSIAYPESGGVSLPSAIPGIPPETAARMQAEFDRLSPEAKAKLDAVATEVFGVRAPLPVVPATTPATVTEPTATTTVSTTPATEPEERDPYEVPAHLKRVAQKAYLWSIEAMERSRYTFKKRPKWMPLVGLYLGSLQRDKQDPIFMFMLERPLLVADDYNRIVEVGAGKRIVVVGGHSLRSSLQQFDGIPECPLLQIYPTGYQTHANGVKEMNLLTLFEPSPHDPNKPQTVSLASAIGREAKAAGR